MLLSSYVGIHNILITNTYLLDILAFRYYTYINFFTFLIFRLKA